jgi:excisionase family DNA binding protein
VNKAALPPEETYLTRREAADYLRRSVPTLERWAMAKQGPRCRQVGGKVLYSLADLRAFVAASHAAP